MHFWSGRLWFDAKICEMGGAACKLYYRHRFKPPGLLQKAPLLLCLSHTRQLSVDVPFAWCISGDLPGWGRKTQLQSECGSFWWHLVAGIIRLACHKRIKRINSQDPSRISTWTMMDYFQQCWIYVYICIYTCLMIHQMSLFSPQNNEYNTYLKKGEYEMKWTNDMLPAHFMLPSRLQLLWLRQSFSIVVRPGEMVTLASLLSCRMRVHGWICCYILKRRDMYSYGISCWNLHIPWYGKLDGPQQKWEPCLFTMVLNICWNGFMHMASHSNPKHLRSGKNQGTQQQHN